MEQAIATITFTQSQLIAICGAVVGNVFVVGIIKKLLVLFIPKILKNKAFEALLPDMATLISIIFMMIYQVWPEWYLNLSIGIISGYFSAAIFKSIKSKFIENNSNKEVVSGTNS